MSARPIVHCLIAIVRPNGRLSKCELVDLGTAYLKVKDEGYMCVGPDPDDLDALAAYERTLTPRPKWHR